MSIGINSFSQINSLVSSLVKQLAAPQLQEAAKAFQSILGGDSFTQGASGAGASGVNLPRPQDALSALSGSGANNGGLQLPARPAGVSPELWSLAANRASGAGAGTGAISGGAGGPVTGGGSNLADAAKAENWQYLDDRQKANMALQEASQKQSEAAALITTLMKMLHDTLTQIIQNMK